MTRPLAAVVLLVWVPAAAAQQASEVVLRGQSEQTYKRLVEAERMLIEGKPAEAAAALERILDEAGDDLVSPDGLHYRPARRVAQVILSKLPADVLRRYRVRADEPARRLLEAGKSARDPQPLRELIDRYFATRPAEEALLLLGELAFERGEFRTAEGYWRRLLPSDDAAEPPYPDPRTDSASIRARVILAAVFQGDYGRARQDLDRLRADAPKAAGRLAGRDGPYVETLQALLDRPPVLAADVAGDGEWTAFGGSAERVGRATARLPRYWPSGPTWKAAIPPDPGGRRFVTPRVAPPRAASFHPVVLDGVAYLADSVRVFGFDPRTGEQRFDFDLRKLPDVKLPPVRVPLPVEHDEDFTLTAAGGRLFARLGSSAVAQFQEDGELPASYLVGFAPPVRAAAAGPPLRMEWLLPPPAAAGTTAAWEGAPVWSGGRLYAAFARFEGTQRVQAVACYDDPPGRPVWVTDVCEVKVGQQDVRHRHEPLTLAGGNVVFCSHAGAVVALDARTGKPAWALRYPKASRPPYARTYRDLNPPVYEGGRVFVAPADADGVFALDAVTGRQLWRQGPFEVDQLLGVTRGRLVCSITGPVRGIRGLNVVNGSYHEPDGWATHDDPNLTSYGRGLVSDEFVLWPTKSELNFLDPDTGQRIRPPVYGPHGNLAYADGVLLVATPTELWGYVAEREQVAGRKSASAARPGDPEAARRLALALADAGRWDEAEAAIRSAEPAADPARARAEWLADRAEREISAGRPDEARALLRQGLGGEYPADWRLRAAGRLLTLEPPGGGEGAAGKFLDGLNQPAGFADGWLPGPAGVPVRLRDLAARHFGAPTPAHVDESTTRPAGRPTDEFDLGKLHRFGPGTAVDRETAFPSARCVPLLPFAGDEGLPGLGPAGGEPVLLVTDGARVLAYRPGADAPAWDAALPEGVAITHAAVRGDAVFAAGPRGVVRLKRSDGGRVWAFRLPDADPLPAAGPRPVVWTAGEPVVTPGLADFALADSRLVARVGDRHLLALDAGSGSVAWVLAAGPDGSLRAGLDPFPFESGPRFARPYLADERGILVQLTTGRRWTIDPATGRVVHTAPSALVPWDGPPVRLGSGRVAAADGPGLVNGVDLNPPRVAWSADAGGEASLTGRPPQARPLHDGLIVAVSRNHGVEFDRLLGAGGTKVWRDHGPALIPAGGVDLSAADTDPLHLYVPAGGHLVALRLADGRTAWVADLASAAGGWRGAWRVRAGSRAVVAHPETPAAEDPPGDAAARAVGRFAFRPAVQRVPALAAGVYDGWAARTVPVLFLDPDTGRVRHRLDLPAAGPVLGAHFGPDHAVVATAGKAYWLRAD
jgi:outer membrane protein assembly factor BamB/tetratricopeptide (TPR) repeat protein